MPGSLRKYARRRGLKVSKFSSGIYTPESSRKYATLQTSGVFTPDISRKYTRVCEGQRIYSRLVAYLHESARDSDQIWDKLADFKVINGTSLRLWILGN